MQSMPHPRPPYLLREVTRHGRLVWYVRIGDGPRTRIKAPYGTTEFNAEYQAAISGTSAKVAAKAASGSLAWALDLYRQSSAWRALSQTTRQHRDQIFRNSLKTAAGTPIAKITHKTMFDSCERRAPSAARHFLQAMRRFFQWALAADLVKADPTSNLKAVQIRGAGFPVWTEDDIAAFQRRWPVGTRERVRSISCFTPACGAVTLSCSGVSTSATAWRGSPRPRRARPPSCRSRPSLPRRWPPARVAI